MKNKIKFVIIFLLIIVLIFAIGIAIMKFYKKDNKIQVSNTNENNTVLQEDNNVLVVDMGKKEEEDKPEPEPKPEPVKDPATITNEIYSLNSEIGTLYIPKTDLTTPIYCVQSMDMMEKMPCFTYATGELNKPGIVFIAGHNKRNGKLFSNNKKLEEGDEFYFKDYTGVELKYIIDSKFTTNSGDTSFLNIETDKPIMILSCCTDANNDDRIIIIGRADES